jgi:hypothetical protein
MAVVGKFDEVDRNFKINDIIVVVGLTGPLF